MSVKIDFGGEPWSAHAQGPWRDDAANPRFPMPLRVAFLAYSQHRANGHAKFRQREVARVLGRTIDGDFVEADRRTVSRAIRQAVDYGLLAEGSKALCLIVPGHRVQGGQGEADDECPRHPDRVKRLRKVASRTPLKAVS